MSALFWKKSVDHWDLWSITYLWPVGYRMILTVNISWTLCMVRWCENFTSQYLLRACPPFYLELKAKWKNASESLKRSCSLLNTRTQWIRILQITRMLTIHIVYLSTPQNLQTLSMLTMSTFSKNPKHLCLFNLQQDLTCLFKKIPSFL